MSKENLKERSCDAILDTAKVIYNEESERFKQAEAKANITIAFSGVLLGIYLTYISSFNPQGNESAYLIYNFIFKSIVLTLLLAGIFFFLRSIKIDQYLQVSLNEIVTYDFASEEESIVKIDLAATYKEAIDNNKEKIEEKLRLYNIGLKFITWGLIIFSVHFIIEEVIKHVT
jgi:hypothetical protein